MPVKDCKTEEHIIDTAMRVFFKEGRFNATTQDIADAAEVNRTLIHYYFRSKEQLLKATFATAKEKYWMKSDTILLSELPFKEKTEKFIDDFMLKIEEYPFIESFLSVEIIKNEINADSLIELPESTPAPLLGFIEEAKIEMEKGTLKKMNPAHFILNIFSLMIFPVVMKPLQKQVLGLDEKEYQILIQERKKIIIELLFENN